MKRLLYTLVAICCPILVFSQDITGLWKGTMLSDSSKQALPYEIFITKTEGKYSGYSYTWFLIDGKQYYGVKKLKVRIAKDDKIIIQDAVLIDNNYPVAPDKNIFQLNVLDLANVGEQATMQGPFATNRTKEYTSLTGNVDVKKVNIFTESDLIAYLQKNGIELNLTAAK